MTTNDQDLRTALDGAAAAVKRVMLALPADFVTSEKCPVDDLMSALGAIRMASAALNDPPRPDHAGGVETDALVDRFATALKAKLRFSEAKHGWQDGWMRPDWKADCQQALVGHIAKGDPVDVAGYAAFCWHHGWSTAPAQAPDKAAEREGVEDAEASYRSWRMLCDATERLPDYRSCYLAGYDAALAPKPTGTEAKDLTWPAGYQETFDAIGKAVTWHPHAGLSISVHGFYRALGFTKRPSGTEAGRGVGAEGLRQAVAAYFAAFDAEPEKDCWDTETGEEEPGAQKFSSDWAHNDHMDAILAAREALRQALAATPTPPTPDSTAQGDGHCGYSECAALGRTVCEDCRDLPPAPADREGGR